MEMIACAPLHRVHFRADARCVHKLLKKFLIAKTAEKWIKGLEVHGDGRRDMMALREHFSGEGNPSRRIATAESMRESLHYKSERSLAFSIFLDSNRGWILQGIYPLKDESVFGCSLITRLGDQTKTQHLKWLWSKDSMNSTINQRLVEQTQEMNFKLEGSGGSTLDDTLRKQYLSSLMSNTLFYFRIVRT